MSHVSRGASDIDERPCSSGAMPQTMDTVHQMRGGGRAQPRTLEPHETLVQVYDHSDRSGVTVQSPVSHGTSDIDERPCSSGALQQIMDTVRQMRGGGRAQSRTLEPPEVASNDSPVWSGDSTMPLEVGGTSAGRGVKRPRSPPSSDCRRRLRPRGLDHLHRAVALETQAQRGTKRKASEDAGGEQRRARMEETAAAPRSRSSFSVVLGPVIEGHVVTWDVVETEQGAPNAAPPMGDGPAARVHVGSSSIDRALGVEEQGNLWEMGTGLQRQQLSPLPRGAGEGRGALTGASATGVEVSPPESPPRRGIG